MQQNLKTASGQTIHYSDPNYKTYLAQGAKPVETAPAPVTPAPPAPTVTPAPKAPVNQISTNDIIAPDRTALDNAAKMGTFVTYDPIKGTAGNRRAVEVGQHGQNDFLETPINGADYAKDPNAYVVTHKNASTLFGFKKPVTPTAPPASDTAGAQDSPIVKTDDKVTADNWLDKSTANLLAQYEEGKGKVSTLSERVRESQALMDTWETAFTADNLSDTTGALDFREDVKRVKDEFTDKSNEIKDRVMAKQFKNAKINALLERTNRTLADMGSDREGVEIEQARRQATDAYNYTMDSIQHRMLTGQYTDAINLMNSASQQLLQNETMRINRLESEARLNAMEADELRAEAEAEDKRRADGWLLIKPENVEALMLKHGEDRVYTNPVTGKTYLLPDEAKQIAFTQTVNGNLVGYNKNGEAVKNFGRAESYSFQENDNGTYTVFDSATGEAVTRTTPAPGNFGVMGTATITGMGSPAWAHGLDVVFEGGKGAQIVAPIDGEVIFAGNNGGFGNQVKIRTEQGEELWLSHLDSINVKVGDMVNSGTFLGSQGNTGTVMGMNGQSYNEADRAAGKGTHTDITIKKTDGSFYTPKEVQELLGSVANGEQNALIKLQAASLLAEISPRFLNNEEALKLAETAIKQNGLNGAKDYLSDQLRFSGQSEVFAEFRNIAGSALTKMPPKQRNLVEDTLDDYINDGDLLGARDFILKVARESAGAVEEKAANGREDALYAINTIQSLLDDFVALGGETGLLKGNIEKFQNNILKKTGNQQLAGIANEIAMTIQKYRQELTGAAFTESEAKEYARLFPGIEKSPELNNALMESMKSAYERNLNMFYQRQLGGVGNWQKLQELTEEFSWGNPDFEDSGVITTADGLKWKINESGNYVQVK